jgi:Immunity protein 27
MNLLPDESELIGDWVFDGSTSARDEVCSRIEYLLENVLQKVAESPKWGSWETLYRDPRDGRFWERTFPKGEMHGGGPPRLAVISRAAAEAKYALNR